MSNSESNTGTPQPKKARTNAGPASPAAQWAAILDGACARPAGGAGGGGAGGGGAAGGSALAMPNPAQLAAMRARQQAVLAQEAGAPGMFARMWRAAAPIERLGQLTGFLGKLITSSPSTLRKQIKIQGFGRESIRYIPPPFLQLLLSLDNPKIRNLVTADKRAGEMKTTALFEMFKILLSIELNQCAKPSGNMQHINADTIINQLQNKYMKSYFMWAYLSQKARKSRTNTTAALTALPARGVIRPEMMSSQVVEEGTFSELAGYKPSPIEMLPRGDLLAVNVFFNDFFANSTDERLKAAIEAALVMEDGAVVVGKIPELKGTADELYNALEAEMREGGVARPVEPVNIYLAALDRDALPAIVNALPPPPPAPAPLANAPRAANGVNSQETEAPSNTNASGGYRRVRRAKKTRKVNRSRKVRRVKRKTHRH